VRLAFVIEAEGRALLVTANGKRPRLTAPPPFTIETMAAEDFARAVAERAETVVAYLTRGVDVLGRREDVLWRRIETAGYDVPKAMGVA
jgi:hypothetical protein